MYMYMYLSEAFIKKSITKVYLKKVIATEDMNFKEMLYL